MACITTCSWCGTCYEEISEEAANDPQRLCMTCFDKASGHAWDCSCGLCKKWHDLVPEER
jgi:lipopolysaccharide biosynthesis regulator YciM